MPIQLEHAINQKMHPDFRDVNIKNLHLGINKIR